MFIGLNTRPLGRFRSTYS